MKKTITLVTFLLLLVFSLNVQAQQKDVLTNESIISLVDLGMSSDIIIAKITTSDVNFTLDVNSLQDLKAKNVPSEVIKTMINHDHQTKLAASDKTGIYIISDSKETQIFPSLFSASKTRTLAAALTYGIASAKVKSMLNGETSKNIIEQDKIEFMFYFSPFRENQQNATDWWFRVTSSPQEFALVKLDVNKRKKYRELETGKANMWVGTDSGINNDEVIKCEIVKVKDGVFSVKPTEEVPPGEYCFFYAGTIPQGGYTNQSVFDFSVQ